MHLTPGPSPKERGECLLGVGLTPTLSLAALRSR